MISYISLSKEAHIFLLLTDEGMTRRKGQCGGLYFENGLVNYKTAYVCLSRELASKPSAGVVLLSCMNNNSKVGCKISPLEHT